MGGEGDRPQPPASCCSPLAFTAWQIFELCTELVIHRERTVSKAEIVGNTCRGSCLGWELVCVCSPLAVVTTIDAGLEVKEMLFHCSADGSLYNTIGEKREDRKSTRLNSSH